MAEGRLYTVTELAKELGMTARAIRFYEDKGLISPRRAGTTRIYSGRDRARMILILRGKRLGFSLADIREYLDLYDVDISRQSQIRLLLTAAGKRRDQLLAQRRAIDEALSELDEIAAQARAALSVADSKPPRRPPFRHASRTEAHSEPKAVVRPRRMANR